MQFARVCSEVLISYWQASTTNNKSFDFRCSNLTAAIEPRFNSRRNTQGQAQRRARKQAVARVALPQSHNMRSERRSLMFVSETTNVLSHLRMCLCIWRSDSIVYAFERVLYGANVAKPLLSDVDRISFDEHLVKVK